MLLKSMSAALVFALVGALATATHAQNAEPDATVAISSRTVAVGVGVTWGEGTLTLNDGTERTFSVQGLTVIDLGISRVEATGQVFNLAQLEDFEGSYVTAEAGATLGAGGSAVVMRNQKGVTVQLRSTSQGVQLTLAPGGAEFVFNN
jgi:hypothetical protein